MLSVTTVRVRAVERWTDVDDRHRGHRPRPRLDAPRTRRHPDLLALRAERQRLGEQAGRVTSANAALREQIQQLKTDDRFLEALAAASSA
jgi:hypothetical protein